MAHPEIEKTVYELRRWCKAKRGRQVEIAKALGVSRASVNEWLKGKLTAQKLFEIRDFLKEQRGGKK
jgi:transcriptional regulator with XRE-family HTH domain